jgi:chromosome partitioning protein
VDLVPSRLEFAWTLRNSAGKERHLRNFLGRHKSRYDLILIDCPPTESMATHAAYLASDYVLVPVKPEFLATIGLPLLATSLATFHDLEADHHVEVAGVVFNDVNESYEHYRSKDDVNNLAAEHGWHVFQTQLSHSDSYPKGTRVRAPIMWTDYARQTKKDEFSRFLTEFLARVGIESKVQS